MGVNDDSESPLTSGLPQITVFKTLDQVSTLTLRMRNKTSELGFSNPAKTIKVTAINKDGTISRNVGVENSGLDT